MSFDARLIHTLVVKRMVATLSSSSETPGGAATTLTADTAVGALELDVASSGSILDGDWLRVGDTGETEIRQVASAPSATVTTVQQGDATHNEIQQITVVATGGTWALSTDDATFNVNPWTMAPVAFDVSAADLATALMAAYQGEEGNFTLTKVGNVYTVEWIGDFGQKALVQMTADGSNLVGDVTLTAPLTLAHDAGDPVREVTGAGTATLDDYGQPVMAETTVDTVAGLIQPRSAHEVELANQAGAVVGEHVGYIRPLATLGTDCWIETGGERYDVLSIADEAGLGHHYKLGLRRVD